MPSLEKNHWLLACGSDAILCPLATSLRGILLAGPSPSTPGHAKTAKRSVESDSLGPGPFPPATIVSVLEIGMALPPTPPPRVARGSFKRARPCSAYRLWGGRQASPRMSDSVGSAKDEARPGGFPLPVPQTLPLLFTESPAPASGRAKLPPPRSAPSPRLWTLRLSRLGSALPFPSEL